MQRMQNNTSESSISTVEKYLYPILTTVVFVLSLVSDWYLMLSYLLLIFTVIMVLNRLGKGIILRELIALHAIFTCVFTPTFGYTVYNMNDAMTVMWVRTMPVTLDTYFSYALPAISLMVTILCWPIRVGELSDQGNSVKLLLARLKPYLQAKPWTGVYIILTGLVGYVLSTILPESFYFVATLIYWCSFAGVLYIYYTEGFKYRKLLLFLFALYILVSAIQSGMFTIVAYMGITLFSYFFLGKKFKLINKLLLFTIAIFLLFVIQSVKHTYRKMTWKEGYSGNLVALFGNLAVDKLSNTDALFSKDALFLTYVRTNQGYNVALVLRRIPKIRPHDNGVNLMRTLAATIVPRILWPDKPEAGGKFNMEFYAGLRIKGWSTNVGPLGEAYGSFGVTGGIIYMAILGAFIRWAYKAMFKTFRARPLLFLWIPVLFYQVTFSMETDTLQILNSLFKGAIFMWLLYRFLPGWFGKEKAVQVRRPFHRAVVS